jgi:hypothetical protein
MGSALPSSDHAEKLAGPHDDLGEVAPEVGTNVGMALLADDCLDGIPIGQVEQVTQADRTSDLDDVQSVVPRTGFG